jgi:hypothetical protein
MISARALGVYVFLLGNGKSISADLVAKEFKEGRNAVLTALKELRDTGLIKTRRYKMNGRFTTRTELVDRGLIPIETLQKLRKITHPDIEKNRATQTIRGKLIETEGEQNQFIAENYVNAETYILNSKLSHDKRLSEYEEKRANSIKKSNLARNQIPMKDWKPKHVCQEFSNRIWTMHIKPWSLNESNFIKAMGAMRKKCNTDGEIEIRVMDKFFVLTDIGQYSEPEHLWRLFLKRFPYLLPDVRAEVLTRRAIENSMNETDDPFWVKRGL